jgi:hypothetical protein
MIHNTITDDDISQRRRNSIHRFNIRQIEKNRFRLSVAALSAARVF